MALAMVLLSGAGVLGRSFLKIVRAETGVQDPDHILVGSIRLPSDKYPSAPARVRYFDRLDAQVRTVAGVEGASVSNTIPTRMVRPASFEIEGRSVPAEGGDSAQFLIAGSDYFRVMGASAISGRVFNLRDDAAALPVVIVNQSFAATFWPAGQPLGKRLRLTARNTPGGWRTVVGVVPNIMQGDPTRQVFKPVVYLPLQQLPLPSAFVFVRTTVAPNQIAPAVRSEIRELDHDVVLEDFATLKAMFAFNRDYMDLEHAELRKHATVAPIYAGIALLIAAVGLVAVITHAVSQRTREIGVRMAIGAAARDIRGMVLREGMMPVAFGLVLGLAFSLAVNRVLQSQLVGVSPYDRVTMAGGPVVLTIVALFACQIPARRATNVDPVVALRSE
jgi:predicted permease